MSAPLVRLASVRVRRGTQTVLDIADLTINRGEVLAVIGPNGSGKSTLLQLLSFLLPPAQGEFAFDGQDIGKAGPALAVRRRVAVVFQIPLLVDSTVANNVALGLRFRHLPKSEAKRRVDLWLERLGVAHLRDRRARTLSGGEAQRVSLARALAIEPDLLLLDEPLAALDAPTRAELLEDLERILRETGVTTVFVTHDRNEALALGDRIAVLIGGSICQAGSPDEVFNTPASEEVAGFVGVETMVPGVVESQFEGLSVIHTAGVDIQVVGDYRPGDQVMVFLRPEDIVLSFRDGPPPSSSMRNNLPGVIAKLSPVGSQYRIVVDCGFPLVSLITKQSRLDMELVPGTAVRASFKASAVHVIRRTERQGHATLEPSMAEQPAAAK